MRLHGKLPIALVLMTATSCSWWTRFDDLQDGVPVVEVPSPAGMPGFATVMATVPYENGTHLFVLGEPNLSPIGATYHIVDDNPSMDPTRSGFCDSGRCLFGGSPTPLRSITIDGIPYESCFIIGVGEQNTEMGLLGTCADGTNFRLPVPEKDPKYPDRTTPADIILEDLTSLALNRILIADIKFDASSEDEPLIAAATKHLGAAWYYPKGSNTPITISPVDPTGHGLQDPFVLLGDTFGSAVAVASVPSGGHLIAISSPRGLDRDIGRVWLYREIDGKIVHTGPNPDIPEPFGCIPGFKSNFGVAMHTGKLFGGASEELLISDGMTISIYDVAALAENPPSCSGPPIASGYVTGLSCVETQSVTGCDYITASFGTAVAFADVDGDGVNELVVGVPTLDVDGTRNAGAVLVYRVDPKGEQTQLLEARFISSRDTGDALGTSVAALRIGARDVIAAGAPGLGSFLLFYCSTLGGEGRSSRRCP